MIALDSSALIAFAAPGDAFHERAVTLMCEAADQPFVSSVITVAEFLVEYARAGSVREAREMLAEVGVMELGLPVDAAERLAKLRAETGVKLPDCCVLLAAEDAGATQIITFDDRLERAAAERGL